MEQSVYIIHLETSTKVCSASLSCDGNSIVKKESHEGFDHAANLTVFMDDCLKEGGITIKDISAVAVSAGPGSYTGLRVGFSVAKGVCFARNIPLIYIPTLETLIEKAVSTHPEYDYYVPMLDARRSEVYTMTVNPSKNEVEHLRPLVLEEGCFHSLTGKVLYFGNGAKKMEPLKKVEDTIIDLPCSATYQSSIAYKKFMASDYQDMAYAIPLYLKPPNITKPKPAL